MNNENRPQQVPANADGNLRETHDDESALHSDWGSDESIRESVGDGQPRDDLDEHREELQVRDDQERVLIDETGARSPDSPRVIACFTVICNILSQSIINNNYFNFTHLMIICMCICSLPLHKLFVAINAFHACAWLQPFAHW